MANKKPTKKQEEDYMAFLRKRLDSKNYKSSVSEAEYEKKNPPQEKAQPKLEVGGGEAK